VKLGSFKELAHIEAQRRGAEVAKKVPLSTQTALLLCANRRSIRESIVRLTHRATSVWRFRAARRSSTTNIIVRFQRGGFGHGVAVTLLPSDQFNFACSPRIQTAQFPDRRRGRGYHRRR
jgi:hypothetical protein